MKNPGSSRAGELGGGTPADLEHYSFPKRIPVADDDGVVMASVTSPCAEVEIHLAAVPAKPFRHQELLTTAKKVLGEIGDISESPRCMHAGVPNSS